MIKQHSQKGSAHAVIIIILVAALILALGFVFWQNFIQKKDAQSASDTTPTASLDTADTSEVITTPTADTTALPDANPGYLVVKDWGVKFKTSVSDQLEYKITSRTGTPSEQLGLSIKTSALVDKSCTSFGADLYRQTSSDSEFTTKKIGNYYYLVTGAPGMCSANAADNTLQTTVLSDLTVNNLQAL